MNSRYKNLLDMAQSCFDNGDYLTALEYAVKARDYDVICRDAYFISGISNYHLKNYSDAKDDIESFLMVTKFIDSDIQIFNSYYILAKCCYFLNELKQSVMYYNECINKFHFSENDDDDYTQKKKDAEKDVIELQIEIGSKLLSDSGLIHIITEQDDPILWRIILWEYDLKTNGLEEVGFDGNNLIFTINSRTKEVTDNYKVIREEWFFEKLFDSEYKPTKNKTDIENKNFNVISIQRPTINVKIVNVNFESYYNGSLKSLESTEWHRHSDGKWQKSEISGRILKG